MLSIYIEVSFEFQMSQLIFVLHVTSLYWKLTWLQLLCMYSLEKQFYTRMGIICVVAMSDIQKSFIRINETAVSWALSQPCIALLVILLKSLPNSMPNLLKHIQGVSHILLEFQSKIQRSLCDLNQFEGKKLNPF